MKPDVLEINDVLQAGVGADSIRDWLSQRPEERLMIVGHNPSLSELVGLLALGQPAPRLCELRKAGVAALSSSTEGGMRLDWLATPKMLRRCGQR